MHIPAGAAVPALTILFFVFSVIGWLMEVVLKWIQYGRFINRGFLIGPYCPIYGSGVVVITVLVGGLQGREGTVGETFLAGLLVCGTLEYLVSWYMEKLFHARWWDYSHKPMNLNGRIWIGNLVLFGLASVVIVKGIDPFAFRVLLSWPPVVLHVLAVCCALLLVSDAAVSHFLMNLVRREIDAQEGDSTEEISRRVRELLRDRSLLLRRIQQAYPDWQARPRALTRQLKEAKANYRQAVRRARKAIRQAVKARRSAGKTGGVDWNALAVQAEEARKAARARLRAVQRRFFSHSEED